VCLKLTAVKVYKIAKCGNIASDSPLSSYTGYREVAPRPERFRGYVSPLVLIFASLIELLLKRPLFRDAVLAAT